MPGLLRAMGRTAVVAGTATAVSNRVSRRQYNRWSNQAEQEEQQQYEAQQQQQPQYQQAPAPAPAAPAQDDTIEQIKKLAELKAQGILTDEEFAAAKAKLLGT
jgi:hypothetical protein